MFVGKNCIVIHEAIKKYFIILKISSLDHYRSCPFFDLDVHNNYNKMDLNFYDTA